MGASARTLAASAGAYQTRALLVASNGLVSVVVLEVKLAFSIASATAVASVPSTEPNCDGADGDVVVGGTVVVVVGAVEVDVDDAGPGCEVTVVVGRLVCCLPPAALTAVVVAVVPHPARAATATKVTIHAAHHPNLLADHCTFDQYGVLDFGSERPVPCRAPLPRRPGAGRGGGGGERHRDVEVGGLPPVCRRRQDRPGRVARR